MGNETRQDGREVRYVPITELRMVADEQTGKRTITGHAAVFGRESVDLWFFKERIEPGAFKATLARDPDVRALWNHDSNIVLGRTRSGTLRLREDETGLAIEIDPPSWAIGHMETMERGDVNQMSFAFRVPPGGDRWEGTIEDPIRVLTEIDMHDGDVSPVTYPAYPQTDVSVRSAAMRQALAPPPEPPQGGLPKEPAQGCSLEVLEAELDLEASL